MFKFRFVTADGELVAEERRERSVVPGQSPTARGGRGPSWSPKGRGDPISPISAHETGGSGHNLPGPEILGVGMCCRGRGPIQTSLCGVFFSPYSKFDRIL